jgi:hypothetical protein
MPLFFAVQRRRPPLLLRPPLPLPIPPMSRFDDAIIYYADIDAFSPSTIFDYWLPTH